MSLQILNASAGSGKTYSLVLTYLKLILDVNKSENAFSEVMAMTFTNKAAFEMKERIISVLDDIAHINQLNSKKQNKTEEIIRVLARDLRTEIPKVIKRASIALKTILHHFEDFNVLTIDKFNLRLIRSFSKELNLNNDFKIVLNEEEVIDEVIESLLDSLDKKNNFELTNLVLNYSKEKLSEEQSWGFQQDLKIFSMILTDEKYFHQIEKLLKMNFSKEKFHFLKDKLTEIESKINQGAKALYDEAILLDFDKLPGKSTSKNAFEKLNNQHIFDFTQDDGGFFTPAFMRTILKEDKGGYLFPQFLVDKVVQFQNQFIQESEKYLLHKMAIKNFHNLALLQYISTELYSIKDKEHILRISEFNTLISNLIQDEYAPFIYERLGTKFKHFLLDEFQDTSRLQWMNLIPLVFESLSNQHSNLIVGDAKQSIYRFKNGVAEQFVCLPGVYNPENNSEIEVKSTYFKEVGEVNVLENNYRSLSNIVYFNNEFYKHIKNYLDNNQIDFYKDCHQNPLGGEGGYIEIFSTNISDEEVIDTNLKLIEWVDSIIEDGYMPGDICILGNTKVECNSWAVELSKKYKVVSEDSLMVQNDEYVKLTVAYLEWYNAQNTELVAKRFIEKYFNLFNPKDLFHFSEYFKIGTKSSFDSKTFIHNCFGSIDQFFPKFENLYALVQDFYNLLGIKEINNPYLHHFSDLLYHFDLSNGADIEQFLKEYHQKFKKSAIQIPDNNESIKVMTGHKSKGLEFPVVILPNVNFGLESKKTKLLVEQDDFFMYVPIAKKSKIKHIKRDSIKELSQVFLDKLNLCYVMTTRASERMYIGNYYKHDSNFGYVFHENLLKITSSLHFSKEDNTFIFGVKSLVSHESDTNEILNFSPTYDSNTLWFPKITMNNELFLDEKGLKDSQIYGNQLHYLLSKITNQNDIESVLSESIHSKLIDVKYKERFENELYQIWNNASYLELFDSTIEILHENAIIAENALIKIPDLIIRKKDRIIVIDFKTGVPNKKYPKQVDEYSKLLFQIYNLPILGYLYYTSTLELYLVSAVEKI
jgi:ATP-dependent exoDNAse (exonuclease V) beta subunit